MDGFHSAGLSRRQFAQSAVAGLMSPYALAGSAAGPAPPPARSETQPQASLPIPSICERKGGDVIDLHTHIFNALYLPVRGIFVRWCELKGVNPLIGMGLGAAVEIAALFKSGLRQTPMARLGPVLESSKIGELEELVAAEIPPEALDDPDVAQAIAVVEGGAVALQALRTRRSNRLEAKGLLRRLLQAFEPAVPAGMFAEEDELESPDQKAESGLAGWLKWVWMMTEADFSIAGLLCESSPGVGLFVHHMMDMEYWYPPKGGPVYGVPTIQLARVSAIVSASKGRLLTFVAFDPVRPRSIEFVERAIDGGAIGVKVYPPNGYRAGGNDDPDLDASLQRLYDFCIGRDVPILAHCTPAGFEAYPDVSGCNSDPEYWRGVLELAKNKQLRLCFGHAGGEEGWLGGTSRQHCKNPHWKLPFAHTVADLCAARDNVYCELSYFNSLKKVTNRQDLRRTLVEWTKTKPALRSKICYGTDWHMPQMYMSTPGRYLDWMHEIFQHSDLAPWAPAFFRGNAGNFLKLRDYVDRNQADGLMDSEAAQHLAGLAK